MTIHGSASKSPCPSELEWAKLAAGAIQGAPADRLLSHAVECHSCAATLKDAVFLLGEGEGPSAGPPETGFADDARISALARQMAAQATATKNSRFNGAVPRSVVAVGRIAAAWMSSNPRMAAACAAAACIALFILPLWWWQTRPVPPPLVKLAAAYSVRRTVDLRIPGASYAPLRVNRSNALTDVPPELLESQAQIQRHLGKAPMAADWLHAQGRAQVLVWQFDAAIDSFQSAAAAKAGSPEFWIDFATAYFERAEVRRDAEDYGKAVELLDRALQGRPRDPVALFNRGIANARLSRTEDAIRDFELCLQAESDPEWKKEAERRLDEIRRLRGGWIRWDRPPGLSSARCAPPALRQATGLSYSRG